MGEWVTVFLGLGVVGGGRMGQAGDYRAEGDGGIGHFVAVGFLALRTGVRLSRSSELNFKKIFLYQYEHKNRESDDFVLILIQNGH